MQLKKHPPPSASQESLVHCNPSSHKLFFSVLLQPVFLLHLSSVHAIPSLHAESTSVFTQFPLLALQESVVQPNESAQFFVVNTQPPLTHVSIVHLLLSSQPESPVQEQPEVPHVGTGGSMQNPSWQKLHCNGKKTFGETPAAGSGHSGSGQSEFCEQAIGVQQPFEHVWSIVQRVFSSHVI